MSPSLSVIARRFSFVRETDGANHGAWVSLFLRYTGNVEGDSWCASFVSYCENIAYRGRYVSKRTASCQEKLAHAREKGWVVSAPRVDDLCFSVDATGHAHHVGIVSVTSPLTTVAGNTDPTGTTSNGTGVFEHTVSPQQKVFVRLPSP